MHQFQDYEIEGIYSKYEYKSLAESVFNKVPEQLAKSINLLRLIRIRMVEKNKQLQTIPLNDAESFLESLDFSKQISQTILFGLNQLIPNLDAITMNTLESAEIILIKNFLHSELHQDN